MASIKRKRRHPTPKTPAFTNQRGVSFRVGDRVADVNIEGEPKGTVVETHALYMLIKWDWRELGTKGRSKVRKRWACSFEKRN